MISRIPRSGKAFTIAVASGAALIVGLWAAVAQVVPPRLIPYEGYLDQDGSPVTTMEGAGLTMTFALYTVPEGGAPIWQEAHDDVPVRAGRFAVTLGGRTAITDAMLRQPALYVGVSIGGVALAGRQRILSAPQAVTAAQAQELSVVGNLVVAGNATVGGGVSVVGQLQGATLNITGNATIGGTLSGRVVGGIFTRWNATSSIQHGCSSWGQSSCLPVRCLRGTLTGVSNGVCFVNEINGNGYCYASLCIE